MHVTKLHILLYKCTNTTLFLSFPFLPLSPSTCSSLSLLLLHLLLFQTSCSSTSPTSPTCFMYMVEGCCASLAFLSQANTTCWHSFQRVKGPQDSNSPSSSMPLAPLLLQPLLLTPLLSCLSFTRQHHSAL